MNIELRVATVDAGDGARLVGAMAAEIRCLYGADIDGAGMPTAGPTELAPPTGGFWVGYDEGGQPVCCGGLKRLSDDAAEIKRMYVVPAVRRQGVGRWLLDQIEDQARAIGYPLVRLDTGAEQPGAQALYEGAGYRPIENFNQHPFATFFGEKAI